MTESIGVIIIIVALFIGYYYIESSFKKSDKYIKKEAEKKLNLLKYQEPEIRNLHDKFYGEEETIDDLMVRISKHYNRFKDKYFTKESESIYLRSKIILTELVDFYKEHNLDIPDFAFELEILLEEIGRIVQPHEYFEKELNQSIDEYNESYNSLIETCKELHDSKYTSVQLITNIETLVNSISNFPKEFNKDFEEIKANKITFKSNENFAVELEEDFRKAEQATDYSKVAGFAALRYGPKAAKYIASTFGKASTGVAISSLKGAAAKNAALAWLGGGSLAAGGKGIAGGKAFLALSGPIAGAAIIGVGFLGQKLYKIFKKNQELEKKKDHIFEIKYNTNKLKLSTFEADYLKIEILNTHKGLKEQFEICKPLYNSKYINLSDDVRKLLGALVNNTLALSRSISKTIE